MQQVINTEQAPQAIGAYSQAIRAGNMVFLSGQIPLDPATMQMVDASFEEQVRQVLRNIEAVALSAGGGLAHIVKLTVYLCDLAQYDAVNQVMSEFWQEVFPARAAVQVAALPKNATVEMDAIMVIVE